MPAGRPTKYKKEYCQQLIEFMAEGYSFEAFAGKVGVNQDTIYQWAKVQPEFSEAKSIAYSQSRIWWEKQAIKGIFSDKDDMKLNNTIWIFNMKNRFGWKDRQDVVTRDETLKSVDTMSEQEIEERLQHALEVLESDEQSKRNVSERGKANSKTRKGKQVKKKKAGNVKRKPT